MVIQVERLAPYYRQLARKIVLAIIAVAFLPYALTFGVFYTSYNASVRSQVVYALSSIVESHKRAIDDFLAERLANLQNVANLTSVAELSRTSDMVNTLRSLREVYGAFVDMGLIDDQGRHVAYAGPYGLEKADYKDTFWFKEVLQQGRYISDVFKGYRGVPHFIVAIKLAWQGRDYILRATIDSARFASLVEGVRLGATGEAFIVNRQGLYQTQSRTHGQLLAPSDLDMPQPFQGVRVLEDVQRRGRDVVVAKTWLKGGDWLLVCQQDTSDAFGSLFEARRNAMLVGAVGGLLVLAITVFLTRHLVGRMAEADKEKELLNEQIIQSGKLASLGELAAGVAHEINNPVAIMVEEAGWIQDLMEEEQALIARSPNRAEYQRALKQIQTQGRRCKEITHKLLGFARRTDAPVQAIQVNDLVKEVVAILERPASYNNVVLESELGGDLPEVAASPAELQQVLINLVNNAIDAMDKTGGRIQVRTRVVRPHEVELIVQDNGPGIPQAVMGRIFDPFFTTKPVGKGTGLGLSICYGIIHKLGGRIEVHSGEGRGAAFTVHLPAVTGLGGGKPA
ncbi:MAG: ATP-binding protein [Pseudomonadota bacterium]